MDELEAKFRVSLDGANDLADFFSKSEAGAAKFSSNLGRALGTAGASISGLSRMVGASLKDFGGKELSGSIGGQARGVLELRDAITRLATESGHGAEIFDGLKDQIQSVSVATNQLQTDVTAAMSAFVERTGDLETARKNIELYGRTATATGTALQDVARVGEVLASKFGIKDQKAAFAVLELQSKAGAIKLSDIATKGPQIFAAAAAGGLSGEKGMREAGALAQMVAGGQGGKGTAASSATIVQAIFSQIRAKTDALERTGIKVQGRDQVEVLQEIIQKTNGDAHKLGEVFKNIRAFRGVEEFAREYRQGRGFTKFEGFRDVTGKSDVIDKDFETRTKTAMERMKATQIARAKFFDKYVGGIAEFGAAHMTELQAGSMGLSGLGKGLSIAGRMMAKGSGAVGALGELADKATAQRVFVVGGRLDGMGGPLGGAGAAGLLGKAGMVVGAGVAAYELTRLVDDATGGRISGGVAKGIGALSGQARALKGVEDAGVDLNATSLQRRKLQRDALVHDFEVKGLSHGKALYAADQQLKAVAEVKNLTVNINGDKADTETDEGTRSPEVLVNRTASGG